MQRSKRRSLGKIRICTVKDEGTGDTVGKYYYDDGGFRVRRISKRDVDGKKYEHEILYTSMYMGLEIQKDTQGNVVTNSYAAVNNIYLNGLRIATIIPSGEVTYYLTDQVDSVKVVVNDQGLPVSRTEFHPYGETWFQEGNDNFAPKYNSQELDKESGLYFYNARYYDAEVGRFVTADSVVPDGGDTQSWNRYSYVNGNPIINSDPTGNEPTIPLSTALSISNYLSNMFSGNGNQTNEKKDSKDVQKQMIASLSNKTVGSGKSWAQHTTKMGETDVILCVGESGDRNSAYKSIINTDPNLLNAFADNLKKNSITKITISSLARASEKIPNDPHVYNEITGKKGKGIDFTELWSNSTEPNMNYALLQDASANVKKEYPPLAKKLFNSLNTDERIGRLETPWLMNLKGGTKEYLNNWRDPKSSRLDKIHNDHAHTGSPN